MNPRKRYPLPYRIYRRMRYLCFVGRLRRKQRKAAEKAEKSARKHAGRIARQQLRVEREAEKRRKQQERRAEASRKEEIRIRLEEERLRSDALEKTARAEQAEKLAGERVFRKYRRRRLLRFMLRACSRNLKRDIRLLNPANAPLLLAYYGSHKRSIRDFLTITLHSTLLFIAAYLAVFFIGLLAASVSGVFFNYNSVIYHHEVLWLVKPEQWFGDSVKMIYTAGPVLSGIIAVFLAIWFAYVRTGTGLGKLFLLWAFMHGFNAFFGSLLIGSLFDRGFGYAIIWSYISDTEKVIYTIISITSMILLGVFVTRSFLISANSYFSKLERPWQRSFIWAQVILPFLLGNGFIALLMLPQVVLYDMTVSLSLGLAIIPIAIGYRFSPSLYFEEDYRMIRIRPWLVIACLAFILVYRLVLGFGIMMG